MNRNQIHGQLQEVHKGSDVKQADESGSEWQRERQGEHLCSDGVNAARPT